VAFQIADDLLDLVGVEGTVGKSLGTDVAQQKLTLPLIRLLCQASGEEDGRIRRLLRDPHGPRREVLHPYLIETGALSYARQRAEEFAGLARAELDCLPASEWRSILDALPDRVVNRNT
jgi:octaprenyl-diphosphate synthase